jgi:hypothetical protein
VKLVIDIVVGVLRWMTEYTEQGFTLLQEVPEEAAATFHRPAGGGFDRHLLARSPARAGKQLVAAPSPRHIWYRWYRGYHVGSQSDESAFS